MFEWPLKKIDDVQDTFGINTKSINVIMNHLDSPNQAKRSGTNQSSVTACVCWDCKICCKPITIKWNLERMVSNHALTIDAFFELWYYKQQLFKWFNGPSWHKTFENLKIETFINDEFPVSLKYDDLVSVYNSKGSVWKD